MSYSRYKMLRKLLNGIPQDVFTQGDLIQVGPFDTYEECQEGNASPDVTPDTPDMQYRWIVSSEPWCDGTDEYKTEKQQQSPDNVVWTDTGATRRGEFVQSHSFNCGFVAERWVNISGEFVCENGDKYAKQKKQTSTDGVTWTDSGDTRKGSLIEVDSADCGYPQYRWVEIPLDVDYECVGDSKYYKEKEQITQDGITWSDTGRTRRGRGAEVHSVDCGYIPPTTVTRWVDAAGEYVCQGTNKYQKQKEQISYNSGESWTDTGNVRAGSLIESQSYDCGYVSYRWVTDPSNYVCQGYDKYAQEIEESSTDGETWTPTGSTRTGALIERDSFDCDYISYRWVTVSGEFVCSGTDKYTKEKEQSTTDGEVWVDTGRERAGSYVETDPSYCDESSYRNKYLTIEVIGSNDYDESYGDYKGGYGLYHCHSVSGHVVYEYFTDAQYRKNGGAWTDYSGGHLSVRQGDKFEWRARGRQGTYNTARFFCNCSEISWHSPTYKVYGNVNSLYDFDNFTDNCYDYSYLFDAFSVNDASNLILPATTLTSSCYAHMFEICEGLMAAPELPAMELAENCYYAMFAGCCSLQEAPELPATTLAEGCYRSMFVNCSALTITPDLYARVLTPHCYQSMFSGNMSLDVIVMMATDMSATECLKDFYDTDYKSKHGCFVKAQGVDLPSYITIHNTWYESSGYTWRMTDECRTICETDGNKYYLEECVCSTSDGSIHTGVYRKGSLVEANSNDCLDTTRNLTFEVLEGSGSINLDSHWGYNVGTPTIRVELRQGVTNQCEYRKNGGEWVRIKNDYINVTEGDIIEWRASIAGKSNYKFYVGSKSTTLTYYNRYKFGTKGNLSMRLYGNINSLYDYDELTTNSYVYSGLFQKLNATTTIDASGLVFPYRLGRGCGELFRDTTLSNTPVLPAGIVSGAEGLNRSSYKGYAYMFYNSSTYPIVEMYGKTFQTSSLEYMFKTNNSGLIYKHPETTNERIQEGWSTERWTLRDAEFLTRWVEIDPAVDYQCDGYKKYKKEKRQFSNDCGLTWSDSSPLRTRKGAFIEDYSEDCGYPENMEYLTFTSLEDGNTFRFTQKIEYSIYDGTVWIDWTSLSANTATPSVNNGQSIKFRANLTPSSSSGIGTFSSTAAFNASGYPDSLLFGDNYGQTDLTGYRYAFENLFENCTYLNGISGLSLPATTLAERCYEYMFKGCTGLISIPSNLLPATTLAVWCYRGMFRGCTGLTSIPSGLLPATTMTVRCYEEMFENCTGLTSIPSGLLPATTLANYCYSYMFSGCTGLASIPSGLLPATTLALRCYYYMFYGCTSLTTAPELPATTLAEECYHSMFEGCTNLNYIKMMATNISASHCLYYWVGGVQTNSGTFVKSPCVQIPRGDNGIPNNWTVVEEGSSTQERWVDVSGEYVCDDGDKYQKQKKQLSTDCGLTWSDSNPLETRAGSLIEAGSSDCTTPTGDYLTFTVPANSPNSSIRFSNPLEYSLNGGAWTSLAANTNSPSLSTNDVLKVRANLMPSTSSGGVGQFSSTGRFNASGYPDSLIFGDNYGQTDLTGYDYTFYALFKDCTYLNDASGLLLSATTLANGCYFNMFENCTSLTTTPTLPAMILAVDCYNSMFFGCTALVSVPSNLLPATTLTEGCYRFMFYGCTSLTTAPDLPSATALPRICYEGMFRDCVSLNYIKMMATDVSAYYCLNRWVDGVSNSGTFVKNTNATIPTGVSGIPENWTVQNATS